MEEDSLWRRVILDKYDQEGMWCTDPVNSPYGVEEWRSIRSH